MPGRWRQVTLAILLSLTLPTMALAASATPRPLAAAPTQLTLTLTQSGGTAVAKAVLRDATGRPLRKGEVTFLRKTTFGQVTLATDTTGFDGDVSTNFAVYPGQSVQVTAQYGGGPGLGASQAKAQFILPPAPILRTLGIYSQVPNPWYIAILVVVLGGIWSAYGYALALIRRIRGAG